MYLPEAFRLDDRPALLAFAAAHPFATLIAPDRDGLSVSHLPLLVDAERGLLFGHLARENTQLAQLAAGAEVLAIFHGPHGYVSHSVYAQQPSVPTWNYVVVHARGRARLLEEQGLRALLDAMVARFDSTGFALQGGEAYLAPMLARIAAFEIAISGVEGKWKLSQNRTLEDQANAAAWLERGDDSSRAVAALMRARLRATEPEAKEK